MEAMQLFTHMVRTSGVPQVEIARRMGRNERFVINTLSRGSLPRVDTFALIADGCGYDVLIRKRSDKTETVIDPPPKE